MPKLNKNSRLKGLPPRIALGEEDSVQTLGNGSVPFSDTKTIVFQEQDDINYGSKLGASSLHLSSELSSSLSGPGNIIAGVTDTWKILSGSSGLNTDTIKPFVDFGLHASDGLSNNIEFFATGSKISDIGIGFSQPLWSKSKIEIDISSKPCSFKCAISQSRFSDSISSDAPGYVSGSSYPMAYYNFETKMWEGIGTGWALQANNRKVLKLVGDTNTNTNSALLDSLEYATIGFAPGILNMGSNIANQLTSSVSQQVEYAEHFLNFGPRTDILKQTTAGHVVDDYGFPYAAKFHATSSQLLKMSEYISEPFLLEKIVLEISGAQFTMFDTVDTGGEYNITSSVFPAVVNTFFILNQSTKTNFLVKPWLNQAPNDLNVSVPKLQELTSDSQPQLVSSGRELVTYNNITSYTNDITDKPLEIIRFENLSESASSFLSMRINISSQVPGAEQNAQMKLGFTKYKLPGSFGDSIADTIVSDGSVTGSYDLLTNIQRDLNIHLSSSISASLEGLSWHKDLVANFTVKSPTTKIILNHKGSSIRSSTGDGDFQGGSIQNSFRFGGSNGLGFDRVSSRRLRTDYRNSTRLSYLNTNIGKTNGILVVTNAVDNVNETIIDFFPTLENRPISHSEPNPYILYPKDSLVFGWQLPVPSDISNIGSIIEAAPYRNQYNTWQHYSIPPRNTALNENIDICQMSFDGPAKVIFYGSYVSEGVESHSRSDTRIAHTPSTNRTIG